MFCPSCGNKLAAEREVEEETGLVVRVTGFLGMWVDQYGSEIDAGQRKTILIIYYHAVPVGPLALKADPKEVSEVAWFVLDEMPAKIAFPAVPALEAWRVALTAGQTITPLADRPGS